MEGAGAVDAELRESTGQVPRAAAAAQRRVSRLIRVQRGRQRRREVQAGQIRQRAARIQQHLAVRSAALLVRRRKHTEHKHRSDGSDTEESHPWSLHLGQKLLQKH